MMERKIIKNIANEDPENHWGFLNVANKVVLDLGCGVNSEFLPTPFYFINKKFAKKVIGVDSNPQSYNWFKTNYNVQNFILFMDMIDRYEKMEFYFDYFKPDVVKMDIEGAEYLLFGLDKELLEPVKEFAIEYHNRVALYACEDFLSKSGYQLEYYNFNHLDLEHQGVLHAKK